MIQDLKVDSLIISIAMTSSLMNLVGRFFQATPAIPEEDLPEG